MLKLRRTAFFSSLISSLALVFIPAFANAQQTPALRLRAALESVGYNCGPAKKQQEAFVHCRGKIEGYSRPLHVYIPTVLSNQKTFAIVYHFHGFWHADWANPFTAENGDYGSYLAASGRNAVLLVPESTGKNATYSEELSSSKQMIRFFSNAEALLEKGGLPVRIDTPRVLTGHSGAYDQIGRMGTWAASGAVPHLKSVRGIGLFDSVYGSRRGLAKFLKIIRANGHGQFFSAYKPQASNGPHNAALQRALGAPRKEGDHADIVFVKDGGISHMAFMRVHFARFLRGALEMRP